MCHNLLDDQTGVLRERVSQPEGTGTGIQRRETRGGGNKAGHDARAEERKEKEEKEKEKKGKKRKKGKKEKGSEAYVRRTMHTRHHEPRTTNHEHALVHCTPVHAARSWPNPASRRVRRRVPSPLRPLRPFAPFAPFAPSPPPPPSAPEPRTQRVAVMTNRTEFPHL